MRSPLDKIIEENMKALFLTPIFLISSFQLSLSQDWAEDTCKLSGNVKKVQYERMVYINQDNILLSEKNTTYYNPQGFCTETIKSNSHMGNESYGFNRIYNENGTKCLKQYELESNDTSTMYNFIYTENSNFVKAVYYTWGKHWSTFNYVYNEKMQLVECFVVIRKDNDTIRTKYEYDFQGKRIKETYISETVKTLKVQEYSENGLLIKEVYLDSNWASRTTIKMNSNGEKIDEQKEDFSYSPNTADSYIIKYDYDSKGQLIRSEKTTPDGILIWESKYEYNDDGAISKSYEHDAIKDKRFEREYYYAYDELGNWISKKTISGQVITEEKQIIEYY